MTTESSVPTSTGYGAYGCDDDWYGLHVATTAPARHRFTADEFDRLGVFGEDDRVELLDGEVVDMAPIGARHAASVGFLTNSLPVQLDGEAVVWVQNPVRLSGVTEPLPDVALLRPPRTRYASAKPTAADVLLVIEVADSSADHDRDRKGALYATAGIPEYWVVDLAAEVVLVLTDPVGGAYRTSAAADRARTLTPRSFPGVSLAVSEILGEG